MRFLRRRGKAPSETVRAAGPFDPRVPRAAYEAGQSHGQRLNVLLNAIYDAAPDDDVLRVWDQFEAAHRALFVVIWAMAEIDNGTLHQYFANSTGDLAAALPQAARCLGADAHAEIFDRALACFDAERVADRAYRNDRLDELEATGEIDRLTDELSELEDDASIWEAMTRYVDAHPATFFV
jgi:hypothetical protein